MTIFNSLGSNYAFSFVLKALFTKNNPRFKQELEALLEKKYDGKVHLVYKGREALELAIRLLNLPKDSLVAVNGFTCFAVEKAIRNAGLKPLYVDINKDTLHFTEKELEKAFTKNPNIKVVIIQNTLGYPVAIEKIQVLCKKHNLILIEDLAHSVGAVYENKKEAGTVGDFVMLSFSQDKMIDAVSGGALIIRNKTYQKSAIPEFFPMPKKQEMLDRFYPLFTFLIRSTYAIGFGKALHELLKKINLLSKPVEQSYTDILHALSPWYCSLVQEQFMKLSENLSHRKSIVKIYSDMLSQSITSVFVKEQRDFAANLRFPVFVANRRDLIAFLKKQGVYVSDIWYDAPIAPKKLLAKTLYKNDCPNGEFVSEHILNLPTHRQVSESLAKRIAALINQWQSQQK